MCPPSLDLLGTQNTIHSPSVPGHWLPGTHIPGVRRETLVRQYPAGAQCSGPAEVSCCPFLLLAKSFWKLQTSGSSFLVFPLVAKTASLFHPLFPCRRLAGQPDLSDPKLGWECLDLASPPCRPADPGVMGRGAWACRMRLAGALPGPRPLFARVTQATVALCWGAGRGRRPRCR